MVERPPPCDPPECQLLFALNDPVAVAFCVTVAALPLIARLPLAWTEPEVPNTLMLPLISRSPFTRIAGLEYDVVVVAACWVSNVSRMRLRVIVVPFGP